jgi:hypothetical protein
MPTDVQELRLYEFPSRILVYGFSRREALCVVQNMVGEGAAAEPLIAYAQVIATNDRAILKRLGIECEGSRVKLGPGPRIPSHRPPPLWMQQLERSRRRRQREE